MVEKAVGERYIVALNMAPATPDWLRKIGAKPMYMGLDLRGGVHFLMQVDRDAVRTQTDERFVSELRTAFRDEKIRYRTIAREAEGGVRVSFQNEEMKRYRLRYMIQIGEALNHFHSQRWIHRDICPRNVMIADDKSARMIDFGLVVPDTAMFCRPGNRTGTASYMAPELIKRQTTDQRLDIFSYAVTCFEMYTKRFPWDAALTIDAVMQHINKLPMHLTELIPNVDPQIAAAIMTG